MGGAPSSGPSIDTRPAADLHTGCGLHGDEQYLRSRVAEATGADLPGPLGAFDDIDVSVRRQLEVVGSTPHLAGGDAARGFVYDVKTGRLREVRS